MGDPKKTRKKYSTPSHPWRKDRLEKEKELTKAYGLKNKKEIYKADSLLRRTKSQLKKLSSKRTEQAAKEKEQILTKLKKIDLINDTSSIDSVLGLEVKNLMDRRLQAIVLKKGLANSPKQARQFITHAHIMVGDKKVTSPCYIVPLSEEGQIGFSPSSSLSKDDHPERIIKKDNIKKELEKTKKKTASKPVDQDLDMPEIPQPSKEVVISEEDALEIEKAVSKEE